MRRLSMVWINRSGGARMLDDEGLADNTIVLFF